MGGNYIGALAAKISLPEPPTWAGRGILPHMLCVGTEKGRLFLVDPDRGVRGEPSSVVGSGEAINGAAFTDRLMAVSNRSEVVIQDLIAGIGPVVLEGGSHGVIASQEGKILAPMGNDGLLIITPSDDGTPNRRVLRPNGADPYFYQTVPIGPPEQGREWFASACRYDGIALIPIGLGRELGDFRMIRKPDPRTGQDEDIVSLCPLNRPEYPYALAVLSMGKVVHFTNDVRTPEFVEMTLARMDGTPYSIHTAQGHLFILTSEKLYVMEDVVERVLLDPGGFSREPIKSFSLEVDAVDCAIVDDEYLLLLHEQYLIVNRVSALSQHFQLAKNMESYQVGDAPETSSPADPQPSAKCEMLGFYPSEMKATLIGAA